MAVKFQGGKAVSASRKYKLGDMWSDDFDYNGMLAAFKKALAGQMSLGDMKLLYNSMEDVNYHSDARKLQDKIDEVSGKQSATQPNPLVQKSIRENLTYAMQSLGSIDGQLKALVTYLDRVDAASKEDASLIAALRKIQVLQRETAEVEKLLNKAGVALLK